MRDRMLWQLAGGPGLAITMFLLAFFCLGWNVTRATPVHGSPPLDLPLTGGSFTISGVVRCETTGLELPGVDVFLWNRDQGAGFSAGLTDASGFYTVTEEVGDYDLIFNPPCGSNCASHSLKGIGGPINFTYHVTLSTGLSLSGTVFGTDEATPISNTAIYAFNLDTADGFGLPPTDVNGQYCLGLAGGRYEITFTPPGCQNLGPATHLVTLSQNSTLAASLPPGFTVAGCISAPAGGPAAGVQIYAFDPASRGFGFSPSEAGGCYTGTLPLGTFDFQFIPPPHLGAGCFTVVNVTSQTVGCPNTALPITLPAGYTLSGRVACQGKPIKNVFVFADPEGAPAPGDDLGGCGLYTVDDGSYELPLPPGTYDISFVPPRTTGFNEKKVTGVQVITDTRLNFDFCILFLPVIWKHSL